MAFEVSQDHERGLILVRYFDRVPVAQRAAAMDRTRVILGATGLRRILIDFDDATAPAEPLQETNAFATRVATDALLRECRIAFVGAASNRFNATLELLADNRHYAFRRFHSRPPAIEWLMG